MRRAVMSMIIGLGLVFGIGFTNESVNACDDCIIETEEHEDCVCGSFQLQCENCEGLYCQEYACECGRCEGIICDEVSEVSETNEVMTYEELMQFDEMIWDMYCEEYCINECEECDSYYYKECMCESCGNDCYDCLHYDYEIFVMDYYDMIMDIYEKVLEGLEDSRVAKEREVEIVICEF